MVEFIKNLLFKVVLTIGVIFAIPIWTAFVLVSELVNQLTTKIFGENND